MVDFAKYIRIFHADPDDDFVTKRTAAIKEVEGVFKKKNGTDDLMKLANDLAIAIQHPDQLDPIVIDTVEKAIKKQSVAFVKEGQEMQILCCGLAALHQYIENNKPTGRNKL